MHKYQFSQYAWTHMILIVVFTQSSFTIANIFEGIFWFFLPASLIVINDIFVYILWFLLWKNTVDQVITKESVGRFHWSFYQRVGSTVILVHFKQETHALPRWISDWFPWKEISILPVQWHALRSQA